MRRSDYIAGSAKAIRLLLVVILLAATVGCLQREGTATYTPVEYVRPSHHTARLNSFLTLEDKLGPAIQLEIDSLEILANGLWLPLISGPMTVDSLEIGNGQHLLGGEAFPPGQYQKLRMTISGGILQKGDGTQLVILSEPQQVTLSLAQSMSLEPGDSKNLDFSWNVEDSILPDNSFAPQFSVDAPLRTLPTNLVFVACPDIDTVFVVRADNNRVVDSIGLTGRPTYLAIDSSAGEKRLYALTPAEKVVKVIDLWSYRVVDSYPTSNDVPTYMTISPDGQWAYLLHQRSGYLSRMNLRTGQISPRVMLANRPSFAVYLAAQKVLAVSLTLSQKVLLLDPETLRVVRTISTGSNPEGLLVLENQLLIAERGSASVTTIDLSNSGSQSQKMVGFGPRRLVDAGNQIFVSNYNDGSLSVLLRGQLSSIQDIYGLGKPLEMAYNDFHRRLYVADELDAALAIIDVGSNQIVGRISLGAPPLGLAEIQ